MTGQPSDERTHLYRAYAQSGELLYIGIGRNWARRWVQHADRSPFYDLVTTLTIETYSNRAIARHAERVAIMSENPIHNVMHNRPGADPDSEHAHCHPNVGLHFDVGSHSNDEPRNSLVGLFFHAHPQRWQGRIVGEPSVGVYMVELFDWLIGDVDCHLLVSMSTMLDGHWRFYDTAEEMRDEYEYRTQAIWDRLDAQATT